MRVIRFRLLRAMLVVGVGSVLIPFRSAGAQQADELSRLIALYRSGSADKAVLGLQALVRGTDSFDQRALLEYHLGLALLKIRPNEGSAALRRSISLDPDLRPDTAASAAERSAWNAARSQMRIPVGIRFEPATAIPRAGDSLKFVVDVDIPVGSGLGAPPARVLLAMSPGRDPIELWNGKAGERASWDGMVGGDFPKPGSYPLIVEVFDDPGEAPMRWRRTLAVNVEAVSQPFALSARPPMVRAMVPIRVRDVEGRKRARRSGLIWGVGGGLVSFAASRMVPDVISMGAPNSAPRVALASVYGAGLASMLFGTTKVVLSATRKHEKTVVVPDEGALRRRRFVEESWLADSARVGLLNGQLASLRRVTVQVRERQ